MQNLHKRLFLISKKGFAISQQDATSYGIGWKYSSDLKDIELKSDVYEIVNDYPGGFGFDLGGIEHGNTINLDTVPFNDMRKLMVEAYKNGGLVTASWHLGNPVTGGSSWDTSGTNVIPQILKGGAFHEKYRTWVKRLADFLKSVQYNNEPIPIIFRPFHEMNGSWFWWGGENVTAIDYIKLWRETVVMLRDEYNVHNLLYVYSPNKLEPQDDYMKYYPADAYVDILGIDIYDFYNTEDYVKAIKHDLKIVKEKAEERKKLYAFTETGLEKLNTENWFTEILYPNIKNTGIAWVLFWRNYTVNHFYMPYKTQLLENDLIKFSKYPETLFLKEVQQIKTKK
ncbi:glycoside hydrolase family 26 protein [Neptunitalea lumnitzerae]|uniref:glycoside hydrolase family 26 protein n=1 Tax=Neptunitalea lumnitzerae TaxID=2965509 RepID=UPI002492BC7D|nr:glycosyl hydrolase [Neptunitalea sp. Y10]